MPTCVRTLGLFLFLTLGLSVHADAASDADKAFGDGQQLLASGDLRGALRAFVTAVKLDRENQQYMQKYLLVRQAVQLQDVVAGESDPRKWEQAAWALRSFFNDQNLHAQVLPIDRALWERSATADNAIQLSETLLGLDRPAEAVKILSSLDRQTATPASEALLAVALAREGKLSEAEAVAARGDGTAASDPGTLYLTARMHAVVGNTGQALDTLTRCFQAVPPSRLDKLKSMARECPDFAAVARLASFETALRTPSQVPESKCSGGASCSSCPMRGGCAHGEKK
ncbi:MAG: hypothetical protein MUF48_10905 [Pirellulaceae bacterium]|jgi:thioredoxin-like negative regulator of GroEL|nr:hypothetical protein [Pirellulaceae bacterium]